MIAEPTLEHYVYYLRRVEGDRRAAIEEHRAAFEGELRTLAAHLERLSGRSIPMWDWPEESGDRRLSQRIVNTGWLDHAAGGRSYFMEARTYGDVYRLQVGYAQSGPAGPEVFARLRAEAWQPAAGDQLLGASSYLCGIPAGDAEELALAALAAYTGARGARLAASRLADGRAAWYGAAERPEAWLLFYPDSEAEDWAGRAILNDVAPRLELYRHKVDRQLAWCETNRPAVAGQERELRGLLEETDRAEPGDLELAGRLARLYRVFNGNAGMLAERQTTVEINLDNLDFVLAELPPRAEDGLLAGLRDGLRRRHRQLVADLKYLDGTRGRAEAALNALRVELAVDRLLDVRAGAGEGVALERGGWPGGPAQIESGVSRPAPLPTLDVAPHISLSAEEQALLQEAHRGFAKVLVEKEFGGGYGGARVLLTLPVTGEGLRAARKVTKLGSVQELRRERDNYMQYVGPLLPHSTARVEAERYAERGGLAGLNYVFVGGGVLGRAVDLEEYYRAHAPHDAGRIVHTLEGLLDRELGEQWYAQAGPLTCFFAAEYGWQMAEHLRLRLRPASLDALWPAEQPPAGANGYREIEPSAIEGEHEGIQPGACLSIQGMVVTRLKRGELTLQDPEGRGIVVGVAFPPGNAAAGLELGGRAGVRGEVVYNRRGRMEDIVRGILPDPAARPSAGAIELPGLPGSYANPLAAYPAVLGQTLEGRQSYVHGDLHLRNVLVDEGGRGWLIDFALVGRRHNLFDFVKLETYLRLMALAGDERAGIPADYVRFEESLAAATLGEAGAGPPAYPPLQAAWRVILAIRRIARKYMARDTGFLTEYFPALFLYCLSVMKYYRPSAPEPTRLAFLTAAALAGYLPGGSRPARPSAHPTPAASPVRGKTGRRWAVLAGVDGYQDGDISRLTCCASDVQAVGRLLVDPARGGYRARLLVDGDAEESPTRNNILAELRNVARSAGAEDLLLFYFSGHGCVEAGEAYLVPCDARLSNLADTAIPVARVKEIMAASAARARVILLDACHSGARIGKADERMTAEFMERVFARAEGTAILASCQQGQISYEWEEAGRSVFSHYLLEGLAGAADLDGKGFVTVQDLNRYVADQVTAWAVERGRAQAPTLGGGWSGDIVLAECGSASAP